MKLVSHEDDDEDADHPERTTDPLLFWQKRFRLNKALIIPFPLEGTRLKKSGYQMFKRWNLGFILRSDRWSTNCDLFPATNETEKHENATIWAIETDRSWKQIAVVFFPRLYMFSFSLSLEQRSVKQDRHNKTISIDLPFPIYRHFRSFPSFSKKILVADPIIFSFSPCCNRATCSFFGWPQIDRASERPSFQKPKRRLDHPKRVWLLPSLSLSFPDNSLRSNEYTSSFGAKNKRCFFDQRTWEINYRSFLELKLPKETRATY